MRLSDEEVKQIYGRAKIPQEYVDVGLKKGVREKRILLHKMYRVFQPLEELGLVDLDL